MKQVQTFAAKTKAKRRHKKGKLAHCKKLGPKSDVRRR
jgi:hypothetical protein